MPEHAWALDLQTDEMVQWKCSNCGIIIDFAKPGFGEPSSGTDVPPDNINDYVGPCEPPAPVVLGLISKKMFLDRFSVPELFAILSSADPSIKVMVFKMSATTDDIDLDRATTKAGIALMVSLGILTQDRADVILAPAPTPVQQGKKKALLFHGSTPKGK